VIALAGLIERITAEVNSYRNAPQHFQRLSLELSFLSQVCNQLMQLSPDDSHDISQLERIRAIALQCLGPLTSFEEKMRKYDKVLGPDKWKVDASSKTGGGVAREAQEKLSEFRKRLHWSMIERKEVDELRTILASEILAINTLLSVQQW
jgi:hypothetical protein